MGLIELIGGGSGFRAGEISDCEFCGFATGALAGSAVFARGRSGVRAETDGLAAGAGLGRLVCGGRAAAGADTLDTAAGRAIGAAPVWSPDETTDT